MIMFIVPAVFLIALAFFGILAWTTGYFRRD